MWKVRVYIENEWVTVQEYIMLNGERVWVDKEYPTATEAIDIGDEYAEDFNSSYHIDKIIRPMSFEVRV